MPKKTTVPGPTHLNQATELVEQQIVLQCESRISAERGEGRECTAFLVDVGVTLFKEPVSHFHRRNREGFAQNWENTPAF